MAFKAGDLVTTGPDPYPGGKQAYLEYLITGVRSNGDYDVILTRLDLPDQRSVGKHFGLSSRANIVLVTNSPPSPWTPGTPTPARSGCLGFLLLWRR